MVVSGVEDKEIKKEARALGCVAYIQKPLILDQLKATIEKALKKDQL